MTGRERLIEAAICRAFELGLPALGLSEVVRFVTDMVSDELGNVPLSEMITSIKNIGEKAERMTEMCNILMRMQSRLQARGAEAVGDMIERGIEAGDPVALEFRRIHPDPDLMMDGVPQTTINRLKAVEALLGTTH